MKLKLPKIFNISSKENKFKDYSYKYHIKMTKEDFLESNVKNARKVKLNDGKVEFYSNYKNNYNNYNNCYTKYNNWIYHGFLNHTF